MTNADGNVDVIGDVHRNADALESLLQDPGYANRNGAWCHPCRTVFFLGDLVDRGPDQLRTISIVRGMIEPRLVAPQRACLDFYVAQDGVSLLDASRIMWTGPASRPEPSGFVL